LDSNAAKDRSSEFVDMPFLRAADAERVRQQLASDLEDDVDITLFAAPSSGLFVPGREGSATGKQAEALLSEVAGLSDRIHLRVVNPRTNLDEATTYGVELDPAVIIERRPIDGVHRPNAGRIRMYGLPAGYEFTTLLAAVTAASRVAPKLRPETLASLARITDPVHIQVFVTPT
jgi:alkyl hydroperoxide reductase subunit AhpF